MSFGPLFTLRARARRARPAASGEPFPACAGWVERRASAPSEPSAGTPHRRASDRQRGPR